jgi:hypothetical protein
MLSLSHHPDHHHQPTTRVTNFRVSSVFMLKQSAGAALDRVSVEIADMKRDLDIA